MSKGLTDREKLKLRKVISGILYEETRVNRAAREAHLAGMKSSEFKKAFSLLEWPPNTVDDIVDAMEYLESMECVEDAKV